MTRRSIENDGQPTFSTLLASAMRQRTATSQITTFSIWYARFADLSEIFPFQVQHVLCVAASVRRCVPASLRSCVRDELTTPVCAAAVLMQGTYTHKTKIGNWREEQEQENVLITHHHRITLSTSSFPLRLAFPPLTVLSQSLGNI